jgi:leader peptidase (prepilin peptidase)/N-methyltransferase
MNFYDTLLGIYVFILGLCFGSFLNVCVYRWPRGESVIKPGSHCPSCDKAIVWYDNIPVLSYLFLKAKCRNCDQKISARYVVIEIFTALIWVALWTKYGLTPLGLVAILLFTVLLGVTMTDLETRLIPDRFTLPMIIIGLVASIFLPQLHGQLIWYEGLFHSFLGMLVGGGSLLLTGLLGSFLFKKEAMGGGDVKLLAMLGAFLGIKNIILVFMIGPILSLPVALYFQFVVKDKYIPFGPFLALAGAWMFLFGDQTWQFIFGIY